MVFPFIFGYEDKDTGDTEDLKLTRVNTMYSELLIELYFKSSKRNKDLKAGI